MFWLFAPARADFNARAVGTRRYIKSPCGGGPQGFGTDDTRAEAGPSAWLMQGSATAISGFLTGTPDFDGVVCTVSKNAHWSHISAGEVVSFQSFLTPELAGQLTFGPAQKNSPGPGDLDEPVFDIAVDEIMTRPERFAASLAQISAGAALKEISPTAGYSQLVGGLIGMELSGLARIGWVGRLRLLPTTLGGHFTPVPLRPKAFKQQSSPAHRGFLRGCGIAIKNGVPKRTKPRVHAT
ncbi:MAG: 2-dehydro-3-deoxygalactonokinase [Sulfitobacter sp. SK025]|nr:MAG: 2-dehydro-3-deoxygalactonokinase [Sulfitobacter sp. SK025]